MQRITAKFKSKCANTGATIKKGDSCYYDRTLKQVYTLASIDSPLPGSEAEKKKIAMQQEQERRSISSYIQAQEEAMFERHGYY